MSIWYIKYKISRPIDMLAINYIAYKFFPNSLYKGSDLTTSFGCDEYDTTKVIKHK
jgi:hypothetical protein